MKARLRTCRGVLVRLSCLTGLSAEVFAGHAWWRPIAAVTLLLGLLVTFHDVWDYLHKRPSRAPVAITRTSPPA
ncbi:hypothetical protein GCM10025734_52560 [Kitasatospora paranensis]|uniref:hypothetical protein n=1 Tax=Kitasatospora paranensis TaxID=258053 RepID=UPI0031E71DFC